MKYYHIKMITMYKTRRGYTVEVYNPTRGKKYRPYKKLPYVRILRLCRIMSKLVETRAGDMSINPGQVVMAVELALR